MRIVRTIILAVLIGFSTPAFCQATDSIKPSFRHEAAFDFSALSTSLLNRSFAGGALDFKYYPLIRWATGLSLAVTAASLSDTFQFHIQKPVFEYVELDWLNQWDLVQSKKWRIGLTLNNGMAIARLGDNALQESYYTKYGSAYRSKEVATNYFYLLQPGFDISYKLFGKNHYPDFYLTAKTKYRMVYGDAHFSTISDFSNYSLSLGISVVGFTK